jgi:hypothetical protein
MSPLIALAAIGLLAAGAIAGIIGVASVAIRREEKNLTLTSEATDPLTQAGRRVNGMYVRAPRRPAGPSPAPPSAAPAPGTALSLQAPSPRRPYPHPTGSDPDAQ